MDVESQSSRSPLLASPPFERYVEDKSSRRGGSKQAAPRIDARVISDAIIGLSDGLTVPFALTAGLSALGNTRVVIFAGLAEVSSFVCTIMKRRKREVMCPMTELWATNVSRTLS